MGARYTSNFKAAKRKIASEGVEKAYRCANVIKNAWVQKLTGEGTGREYRVPGTNRTYTASAPGEPPAVLFGDLRRSPAIRVFEEGLNVGYDIGSDLEKAPMLEKGTYKMEPRPSLKPAYEESKRELKSILESEWL